MRLSISKSLIGSKSSKLINNIRDYETPVDSIHDTTQRPVACIQEPTMDEEDEADDATNNLSYESGKKSEPRESTESGLLICNGKTEIPSNHRQESSFFASEDVGEGQNEAANCKEVDQYVAKKRDIELSFCMEDSLLDSVELDKILRETRSGEGMGNCRNSNSSPTLKEENDFEGAFINLGQVLFRNQPNRIASDLKYAVVSEAGVRKKLFGNDSWMSPPAFYATTTICTIISVFASYFLVTDFIQREGRTSDTFEVKEEDFTKEVFDQAMYILSTLNLPSCNEEELLVESASSLTQACLPFLFSVIVMLVLNVHSHSMNHRLPGAIGDNPKSTKGDTKSIKIPPSAKRHLSLNKMNIQRELAALNKNHIITSSFTTEAISPTGEISSVKRSARIESLKVKKEFENSLKVNLAVLFDLECEIPQINKNRVM